MNDRNPPPFPDAKPGDATMPELPEAKKHPRNWDKKDFAAALEGAMVELDSRAKIIVDQQIQIIVYMMVAHHRAGHVSVELAAKRCDMSVDDFKRAMTVCDNEARIELKDVKIQEG